MTDKFTCIDLFTGIAGIQYALRGLLEPRLYCEIDPEVQSVLKRLMDDGRIPRAPIVHDVRDTDAILQHVPLEMQLDLVIASPSCKGFSCLNPKRPGLEHAETSLYACVIDLVTHLRPHAVFVENVPGIVPDLHQLQMQGYTMVHGIYSAESVGAPHLRRRFYGLYVREGSDIVSRLRSALQTHEITLPDWSVAAEPQHIVELPHGTDYVMQSARIGMLGNSIVPLCAHDALCDLVGCPRMRDPPHPRTMVLDPDMAETPRKYGNCAAIPHAVTRERFPTPRYSQRRSANRLISRCVSDLPSFLRYWTDARGPRLGLVNVDFLEWLMGLPVGWTV